MLLQRPDVPTTSGAGRWALEPGFADLFSPALTGQALQTAIETWRETHMAPGGRLRADQAAARAKADHQISVRLPTGEHRLLEPGTASLILKGVIEQWAPRRLGEPVVLAISQPGEKLFALDDGQLRRIGLRLDLGRVLPDALIADLGGDEVIFWMIEAVATDGPITEPRRRALLAWAEAQGIKEGQCGFLTAFVSRSH